MTLWDIDLCVEKDTETQGKQRCMIYMVFWNDRNEESGCWASRNLCTPENLTSRLPIRLVLSTCEVKKPWDKDVKLCLECQTTNLHNLWVKITAGAVMALWLRALAALQRMGGQLTTITTPFTGDLTPSSGHWGHCACVVYRHPCRWNNQTHKIQKTKIKK